MRIHRLLLITGNPGKASEFTDLLSLESLQLDHRPLDLIEIQSLDIEEIARFKTRQVLERSFSEWHEYDAVLTDDTALYCQDLNGLPGPLIRWFLDAMGAEGLLRLMTSDQPKATAVCVLTLGMIRTKQIIQFKGEVAGWITEPKGKHGFGWDIIFQPENSEQTYGEMTSAKKNRISHRSQAIHRLRNWLLTG